METSAAVDIAAPAVAADGNKYKHKFEVYIYFIVLIFAIKLSGSTFPTYKGLSGSNLTSG